MSDLLDTRDLMARFDELESERDDLETDEAKGQWDDSDDGKEFADLEELLEELRGNGGDEQWKGSWYPVTLIADSYFVEAMEELVKDIGDMPSEIPGYMVIDWDATAENLRADYSSVEYQGTTYWYR